MELVRVILELCILVVLSDEIMYNLQGRCKKSSIKKHGGSNIEWTHQFRILSLQCQLVNRTPGITNLFVPALDHSQNSYLPYLRRNRYSRLTTRAATSPTMAMSRSAQNHGCHGKNWSDAMVPTYWMALLGCCRGRLGGV